MRMVYSGLGPLLRVERAERWVHPGPGLGGASSCASSVNSGLGGATLRGLKKSFASREAIALASSAEMVGWASGFPSEDTWIGNLRCNVGSETDVLGVLRERYRSRA